MPRYNLKWSTEKGPDGPSSLASQYPGTTPEKAAANIVRDGHISEAELEPFNLLEWEELDEDGEVVKSDKIKLKK